VKEIEMRTVHAVTKTSLAAAAMMAGSLAFAQAPLTQPNNSAGSPVDTPPAVIIVVPADAAPSRPMLVDRAEGMPTQTDSAIVVFHKLDTSNRGYLTRSDVAQLPGYVAFDEADTNHDGRLDTDEFQRAWADHGTSGQ
jgi:hypothetical protein